MAQPSHADMPPPPPPPPIPSSDARLAIALDDAADAPMADKHDLFQLPPIEALHLLSASIELLVRMTGDIPPTPPPKTPTYPQMSDMQAEKENIARSHSEKSQARLLRQQQPALQATVLNKGGPSGASPRPPGSAPAGSLNNKLQAYSASMAAQVKSQQQQQMRRDGRGGMASSCGPVDGVQLRQRSPPSYPGISPPDESQPYIVVGADSQPVNLQHGAITRKFFSKQIPPIPIAQYLLRLHQFCPMSTAVYLATSLYIHRLAVEERAIPVTRRNAHRLVLAGLRVAMKALEDLSYPHNKIAKVGGVSEVELARLEISFCFLAGFELIVGEEPLRRHWETLRDGRAQQMLRGTEVPALKLSRMPREVAVTPAGG